MTSQFFKVLDSKVSAEEPISFPSALLFLIIVLSILIPSYLLFGELVAGGIIAGTVALFLCFQFPKLWIYGVLFSSYFFYAKSSNEESSQPIIFAMAYHLSLFVWIFSHIYLKKERLIKHWVDLMFVFFLGFLALNGILSLLNDVEFISWIKGWQLFLIVLYYYPIREIFRKREQQTLLMLVCAIVLTIQGVSNIYQYKTALTNFKFASQLLYVGIRQGAAVFSVASLATLAGVLFTKNTKLRLLLLGFHLFCFGVLLVSLSRAAWVGYAFGMFLIGIVLRGTHRKNFIIGSISLASILLIVGFFFFGQYFKIALNVVNQRFSSSAKFSTDPSYLSRTYENEVLLEGIQEYPLGGKGLQNMHNRYDAITRYTVVNTYAHNNYLGSAQKMGIPLATLFFGILGAIFLRNWKMARVATDSRTLFYTVSSLSGLMSMFVFNFVGSIFDQREGVFLMAILFAMSFMGTQAESDISRHSLVENTDKNNSQLLLNKT